MAKFIDSHKGPKLSPEAVKRVADEIKSSKVDEFGVKTLNVYYDDEGTIFCLTEGPDAEAVKKHHEKLRLPCDYITEIKSVI